MAAGGNDAAIRCLLKVSTGLTDPDVDAYRQQVDDVMSHGPLATDGGTHPESFIRVRALDAWQRGEEDVIDAMIRGALRIEALDCLGQREVDALTRRFLRLGLRHPWLRCEAVIGQARLIWPDLGMEDLDAGDEAAVAEATREKWPICGRQYMALGTVKWFNDAKGYGFISRSDGKDVFVHYSSISGEGFRTLNQGQSVEYEEQQGPKGLFAAKVLKVVGASP